MDDVPVLYGGDGAAFSGFGTLILKRSAPLILM